MPRIHELPINGKTTLEDLRAFFMQCWFEDAPYETVLQAIDRDGVPTLVAEWQEPKT